MESISCSEWGHILSSLRLPSSSWWLLSLFSLHTLSRGPRWRLFPDQCGDLPCECGPLFCSSCQNIWQPVCALIFLHVLGMSFQFHWHTHGCSHTTWDAVHHSFLLVFSQQFCFSPSSSYQTAFLVLFSVVLIVAIHYCQGLSSFCCSSETHTLKAHSLRVLTMPVIVLGRWWERKWRSASMDFVPVDSCWELFHAFFIDISRKAIWSSYM